MRTRIFNKMTAQEVEDYLARGGDTIFIAVGVVECHGNLPIDCETICPEAYCSLLAEKADGLAMINLPYFYPAATIISNATVQFGIRDGIDYLMKIAHSLVGQGFRRLFLVSGHGPAGGTVDAFCAEFFSETLVHPCHLARIQSQDSMAVMAGFDPEKGPTPQQEEVFEAMKYKMYGAYKIMGQMEYLPVDPNYMNPPEERPKLAPTLDKLSVLCREFGGFPTMIYSDPGQHGGGHVFRSEEERLEYCSKGEEILRREVENCRILELKEIVGKYHEYIGEMYKKYPRIKKH